jgi:hypothetical protein
LSVGDVAAAVASAALVCAGCSGDGSPERPTPTPDFVIAVGNETFVMRTTDPDTARRALDNLNRRNRMFPIGPLRVGNGGFNAPWSWHLDPDAVRMTESAVEVCDAKPSYVEAHRDAFLQVGFCPWAGQVVAVRPR